MDLLSTKTFTLLGPLSMALELLVRLQRLSTMTDLRPSTE